MRDYTIKRDLRCGFRWTDARGIVHDPDADHANALATLDAARGQATFYLGASAYVGYG